MIRNAAGDSLAMGNIYCFSWKAAYKGIVPDSFLDALTPESRAPAAEHISPVNNFVYEENGMLLGLVNCGASRDGQPGNLGELRAIYVLPGCWGKGIGRALFAAAKASLKERGYEGFCLWVLSGNARARRFYERMGMAPTGEERMITIAGKDIPETKYEYRSAKP